MKILDTVDNSPCSKTLTIEVPSEEITQEVDSLYKELTAHAEIPGFRPGHAPLHLLKLRFGRKVEEEARGKAAEKACQSALEELSLNVVGEPKVDIDKDEEKAEGEAKPTDTMKITFEFEFVPEYDVVDYNDLEVEIQKMEVNDEQVDQILDSHRNQAAILVPAKESKKIAKGDIVTLDVTATCDGEAFPEATHEGYMFEVGTREHLPGFEKEIKGLKVDEEKSFDLTLTDDYSIEKYRGKEAHFEVKVRSISKRELPELDDEFAKDIGFESLEEYKGKVRENLEHQLEARRKEAIASAIRDKLEQANPIPVPDTMVESEFRYINAMQNLELSRMGASLDALGDVKDQMLAENRQRAEKRVRTSLILEKIAEKEEVKIGETEYLDYLEDVARAQGEDPDRFVSYVHKRGIEGYYQRQALERKILESMMEKVQVKEVEPKTEKPKKTKKESE